MEIQEAILHLKGSLSALDSLGLMAASACVCAAIHHLEDARVERFEDKIASVDFSELDAILEMVNL